MASNSRGEPGQSEPRPEQDQPSSKQADASADAGEPNTHPDAKAPDYSPQKPQILDRIISSLTLFVLFLTFLAALYAGNEADRLATDTEKATEEAREASSKQYGAMVEQQKLCKAN
jgi:hypothetical protein